MVAVSYEQFERTLRALHALPDAPEAHGTLAGALCASSLYRLDDWLIEILPDGAPPAVSDALREVYTSTARGLSSPQSEFELLLPDDDVAIGDRTEALGQWCQGFLYGLGSGAIPDPAAVSPEAGEIVHDLSAIAQVGVDTSEDDETNEAAFAEVVEFVRVGVQVLFVELASRRSDAPPPATMH
jgi:hypothetical protein